jgi:predicted transcriptional regulator
MQIQDVMTAKVMTIEAHDSIANARTSMRHARVHQLVVTGQHGQVVGVLGAADLNGAPDAGRVEDFMSRRLLTVGPDTTVRAAAALMRAHAVGSLPVMQGQRLVGIVTVSDMLKVVADADESLRLL